MVKEIESLMEGYLNWLKDRTHLRQVDENWVEISTPNLDRNNDYLQIYVRSDDNQYLLTDDGYILRDLEISGCPIDSNKRRELLKANLNGFGVELTEEKLSVRASRMDFPLKKHNLIQAMLAVNDMFFLASPTVTSLFTEDIAAWLDLQNIRAFPNFKLTGESKFDHYFDFAIPKSKKSPERLLKAINQPNKPSAERMVFSWIDTQKVRPEKSIVYAILNDRERRVSSSVISALNSYQIVPLQWSKREQYKDALVA